jgi:hypothetical protein
MRISWVLLNGKVLGQVSRADCMITRWPEVLRGDHTIIAVASWTLRLNRTRFDVDIFAIG